MGNQLISQSKLMYYPTDNHEIYRMLGIIGRISMSIRAREEVRDFVGEDIYIKLLEDSANNFRSSFAVGAYNYFLENKQYDMIEKYFELSIGFSDHDTITVFDPFAGEAVWLEMIKNTVKRDKINSAKIHLIANELETNRYNVIKQNDSIDEVYNKAYEEFRELPKHSVSLLLYNPPYGDTNGKRNVLHYLEMIVEDELLYKSNNYNDNGKIIMVIRRDDLLESLPFITKHFDVDEKLIYRVNDEEYNRYKQYVVYASLKSKPYNEQNVNEAMRHRNEIEKIEEIIENNYEFNISMYDTYNMRPPAVPYNQIKENHKILKEDSITVSITNGDSWDWVKEVTGIKEIDSDKIVKPTPLKSGEIANIIASGMIDGEMDLNDTGEGFHIVAGGTKEQVHQEVIQEENRKGELENKTKTLVYSQPYLNILINDNGKVKIKELQGGTELE